MESRSKAYLTLDIDETVVNGHIHNTIMGAINELSDQIRVIRQQIKLLNGLETVESARKKHEEMNKPLREEIAKADSEEARAALQQFLMPTNDDDLTKLVADANQQRAELKRQLKAANQQHVDLLKNPKSQWELVKHLEPLGSKDEWQEAFKAARENNFEIAGLSYSSFPEVTAIFFKEKLGTECEIVPQNREQEKIELDPNKITLISFLPDPVEQRIHGKNLHAEQYLKAKGVADEPDIKKRTVLVDDSASNVKIAASSGYHAIQVKPKKTYHLKDIIAHVQQHNPEKQQAKEAKNTANDKLPTASKTGLFSKKSGVSSSSQHAEKVQRPSNKK